MSEPGASFSVEALSSAWAAHPLWSRLPAAAAEPCLRQWQVCHTAPGDVVARAAELGQRLGWVLRGGAEHVDESGAKAGLSLTAGDLFGHSASPESVEPRRHVRAADSGCTVAWLEADEVEALLEQYPVLTGRLWLPQASRPAAVMPNLHDALLGVPLQSLLTRSPVAVTASASIREAALCMRQAGVSSLLITERDQGEGALLGLITDRDLRNRVVAEGVSVEGPLMSIATRGVHTLPGSASVFEAMLLMTRHGVHHVPVMEDARVLGVVSVTRLSEQHASSPLTLAASVHRQNSLEGLQLLAAQVGLVQRQLAAAEVSAYNCGRMLTAITDAITVRLLQLAQARLGPPPVPYVWVAAGSQARAEQTARSDQDNCLVLDDDYDPVAHRAYFQELAASVCDGLAACGYVHCPGEMMAMTDAWRQPARQWRAYFEKWVNTPEPRALMLTSVFFDLRAVHGEAGLLDSLRRDVLASTRINRIFQAHMASNALGHAPALGMFGRLAVGRSGEHAGTLDLKHEGLVPIIDLARVYALASGAQAVNTRDRLLAVAGEGEVTEQAARDLCDALEFIGFMRIRHQARQMAEGQAPTNFLRPDSLSNLERRQLKDAFSVTQTLQSVLSQRYTAGRF